MRLILALFTGPFWVQLLAAAACLWLGQIVRDDIAARQATLADMALQPAPAVIGIDGYTPPDPRPQIHEVHLSVQIDPSQISPLPAQSALMPSSLIPADLIPSGLIPSGLIPATERHLVVLFAPSDRAGTTTVQGAMVLTAAQRSQLDRWIAAQTTSGGALGPVVTVNGLHRAPAHAALVNRALAERGLTKAAGYVDVAPFLDPRAEALAAAGHVAPWAEWGAFALAGAMVLLALVNRRRRSGGGRARGGPKGAAQDAAPKAAAAPAAKPVPEPAPVATAPQAPASQGGAYDPLRAVSQRSGQRPAEPVAAAAQASRAPAGAARLPSVRLVLALVGVGLIGVGALSMLDTSAPDTIVMQPMAPSTPEPTAALTMVTLADAPLPAVWMGVTRPPVTRTEPKDAAAAPAAEVVETVIPASAAADQPANARPVLSAAPQLPASPVLSASPVSPMTMPGSTTIAADSRTAGTAAPDVAGPAAAPVAAANDGLPRISPHTDSHGSASAPDAPGSVPAAERAVTTTAAPGPDLSMQMPEPRRATLQPAAMSTEPQDTQADLPPAGGPDQALGTPPEIPAGPFAKGLAVLLPVLATMGLVFGSIVVLPRRLPQLASVIPVGPRRASGRLAEDPFDRLAARLAAERAGA